MLDVATEEWKIVTRFPNYEVSSLGRIRRAVASTRAPAGYVMKPQVNNHGRSFVVFWSGHGRSSTVEIHVLVAAAFIGPRPDGLQINHKDGNPQNNAVENLEYCTAGDNRRHAWRTGLFRPVRYCGEKHPMAKLTEEQAIEILQSRSTVSVRDMSVKYGVTKNTINYLISGKTWKHLSREPVMRQT